MLSLAKACPPFAVARAVILRSAATKDLAVNLLPFPLSPVAYCLFLAFLIPSPFFLPASFDIITQASFGGFVG